MSSGKNENILQAIASPEDTREIAQQELGETAAVKEHAFNQLRELILGEPLLDCPMDEDFLAKFLRARKYDVQSAFKNVRTYFKVRRDYPEMFAELKPSSVPFNDACRKHRLVTLSRKTDSKGRAVVKFRTGAWNTDICSLNDFFRITVSHIAHYTPSAIKKFMTLIQECLPLRIKAVYIINNPALFDILFTIAKPFMEAKLVKRIRFFGYDCEELHNLVPEDVIPEEHGGTNESYDFDTIEEELKKEEAFFEKINAHGYRRIEENEEGVSRI
ncbi:hypothetical protein MRX96_013118 [Rhipicephalus microplus]